MSRMKDIRKLEKQVEKLKSSQEKRIKFLDKMILTVFISTFIFVIAIYLLIWFKGYEPTQLIDSWFKVMVGELMITGLIKVVGEIINKKEGEKDNENKLETEADQ